MKKLSLEFFQKCGAVGGSSKSLAKKLAAQQNIKKRWANHKKALAQTIDTKGLNNKVKKD